MAVFKTKLYFDAALNCRNTTRIGNNLLSILKFFLSSLAKKNVAHLRHIQPKRNPNHQNHYYILLSLSFKVVQFLFAISIRSDGFLIHISLTLGL
jgi:hypothetical protein